MLLEKYDLNNEEKDLLFKEMKKKLEEGITEADIEKMMSQEEDNKKEYTRDEYVYLSNGEEIENNNTIFNIITISIRKLTGNSCSMFIKSSCSISICSRTFCLTISGVMLSNLE